MTLNQITLLHHALYSNLSIANFSFQRAQSQSHQTTTNRAKKGQMHIAKDDIVNIDQ